MDKGRNCDSSNYSAGSGNQGNIKVVQNDSFGNTTERNIKPTNVTVTKQKTEKDKKQTYGYDGTSYCRNCGRNEDKSICLADMRVCREYVRMRRKDGTYVGVCKKRYDAKQEKKRQQQRDIRNTQDISSYNGRRI